MPELKIRDIVETTLNSALTERCGTPADARAIRALAMEELGRAPALDRLREILDRYPSVLAFDSSALRAFVFGVALSPDVVEMANLLVARSNRDKGLGTRLIRCFEEEARPEYRAIIVANSGLWPVRTGAKRSAVSLYQRLGYRQIFATPATAILVKELSVDA